jgi:transcriptional regulator with XRE-family HTH domain
MDSIKNGRLPPLPGEGFMSSQNLKDAALQASIGSVIRRRRREQNLTQTELGGDVYSKSYVSAIENGHLAPSIDALKYFAVRLGEPDDYFLLFIHQTALETSRSSWEGGSINFLIQEKAILLDTLLEQTGSSDFQIPDTFFTLSAEALDQLSSSKRAHYLFLQGRMFQKKADYPAAIQAFETALAYETHQVHSAAILDELGRCYLRRHLPHTALYYAARAHQIVSRENALFATPLLPFQIELHCGEACLALGLYQHACESFERARVYLSAQQDVHTTGRFYRGLGYCTYALAAQEAYASNKATDQIELQYQRALSYLLQSYTLAQMGEDLPEARRLRLMLATVQLDMGAWRLRYPGQKEEEHTTLNSGQQTSLFSLLDSTCEHCRQVLISLQDGSPSLETNAREWASVASIALALLIRATVQRALLAHSGGHNDLLQRERSFAVSLCQQVLDTYQEKTQLETLVWRVGNILEPFGTSPLAPLPRFSEAALPQEREIPWSFFMSQAEVYWAAGEVSEMLARTAETPDFSSESYTRADTCFLRTLEALNVHQVRQQLDPGYLMRTYQRYTSLLQERLSEALDDSQRASADQIAGTLLALCKQHFALPQEYPALS